MILKYFLAGTLFVYSLGRIVITIVMDPRSNKWDKRRRALFAKLDEDPVRIKAKAMTFYHKKQWSEALAAFDKLLDSGIMLDSPAEKGPDHQEVLSEIHTFNANSSRNSQLVFLIEFDYPRQSQASTGLDRRCSVRQQSCTGYDGPAAGAAQTKAEGGCWQQYCN